MAKNFIKILLCSLAILLFVTSWDINATYASCVGGDGERVLGSGTSIIKVNSVYIENGLTVLAPLA